MTRVDEPAEWLWHVDAGDQPLGRVERSHAHRDELRHRSGIVFLLAADQRVFLTDRATTKSLWPGCLDTSASFHVTHGETYQQAAHREAREELGIEEPLHLIGRFHHHDPPELQWVAVFVARHGGGPLVLDPAEARAGRFFTLPQAEHALRERACTPWLRDGLPLLRSYLRE